MFRMNGIRLSLVVSILAAIVLAACGGGSTPAPPAEQVTPAAEASPVSAGSSGQADLGFRPGVNGFGFENYGNDVGPTNLTPVEMRRMFGDQVCARIQDDTCTLTPVAGQWMQQTNDAMSGGHCEGFAALSLLMYTSQVSAADFGGSTAHDLALPNNDPLQREIAYWWATQGTRPTSQDEIKRTPNEIVDILTEAFKADAKAQDTYTVGIFKRDMTGGHAITPYAVVDNGDGTVSIMVYDNNWPDQERQIIVDRTANTWKYEASINPDEPAALYEGDADTFTLSLTPTSARLGQQACDFCADGAASRAGGVAGRPAPDPARLDEELIRYARFRGAQARLGRNWRAGCAGMSTDGAGCAAGGDEARTKRSQRASQNPRRGRATAGPDPRGLPNVPPPPHHRGRRPLSAAAVGVGGAPGDARRGVG